MKSHLLLVREVLKELGTWCCTSTTLDYKYIQRRVDGEGFSFLTITLPTFCSDLQKGLDSGKVDSTLFVGYKKRGCLPTFLSGFTSLIFDTDSGLLLDEPSIDAIFSVRQICLLYSKIELPCTDARVRSSFAKYIECEQQVRLNDVSLDESEKIRFREMAFLLWRDVLLFMDRNIYEGNVIPKHGPGSTADRLSGNAKYNQTCWTERLEKYFPHGEYAFPSWSHFLDSPPLTILDPGSEIPVRVITVPKTLKTPRIIAIEPTCMQYMQQGILELLVSKLENNGKFSSLIGFTDQLPNQEMARIGSLSGNLATLDLSEASDRVSNQLVRLLAHYTPHFGEALDATRSRKADVPGYGVQRLSKYASMGSALCFPIEAMVFLTIIFLGIEDELGTPLTRKMIKSFCGSVRVYGDDIIVPVNMVRSVVSKLEDFGLLVNTGKSFWTGKFRESCGKEFYNGHDVSVVKVRSEFPTQRKHVSEVVSLVSLRNQLYMLGLWETCKYLDPKIEKLIPFPILEDTSPGIGRISFLPPQGERDCEHLQVPLTKAAVLVPIIPRSPLEGSGALLKWFLKRGDEPFVDRNHLERAGRPDAVNIKLRWVPVY
jgi:hypothetical protein